MNAKSRIQLQRKRGHSPIIDEMVFGRAAIRACTHDLALLRFRARDVVYPPKGRAVLRESITAISLAQSRERKRNRSAHGRSVVVALADAAPHVASVAAVTGSDVAIAREMAPRAARRTHERDGTVARFVFDVDLSADETLRVSAIPRTVTVFYGVQRDQSLYASDGRCETRRTSTQDAGFREICFLVVPASDLIRLVHVSSQDKASDRSKDAHRCRTVVDNFALDRFSESFLIVEEHRAFDVDSAVFLACPVLTRA